MPSSFTTQVLPGTAARQTCGVRWLAEILAGKHPRGRDGAVPGAVEASRDHDGPATKRLEEADAVERLQVRKALARTDGPVAARSHAATDSRPSLPAHPTPILSLAPHQSQDYCRRIYGLCKERLLIVVDISSLREQRFDRID